MILVDANVLIYAVNADSPHHQAARRWWEETLSGTVQIGLSWTVILAFLRITTRPGIFERPLSTEDAVAFVDDWLAQPYVSIVDNGAVHWPIFRNLQLAVGTAGNLTSDTLLAAIALELGAEICSTDYDFARFTGVRYTNPLTD